MLACKYSLIFLLFFTMSCKKNRTCVCTSSAGSYEAGDIEKTKSQAKKYCKDLSVGETNCELKK